MNKKLEKINAVVFVLYFIVYLFVFEFFEENKTIFNIRHFALLFAIIIALFTLIHKYGTKFYQRKLRCTALLYVLPLGMIFIAISIIKALTVNMSFSFRSIVQTFLFVGPTFYAFLIINILPPKKVLQLLKVVLWVFIAFYFMEGRHLPWEFFKIENWQGIKPFGTDSFTESHVCAESFLQLFVIFFFVQKYAKNIKIANIKLYTILSLIFTILSFKRLGVLFVLFLIISSKFIDYTQKINWKYKASIFATAFTIITIVYVSFLQGNLFPNANIDKITTNRGWILSLWEKKNFFSYGYGTSLHVIGRYLEMDLVQIYIELGALALWLFCFLYSKIANKTLYSNILILYVFGNLLTSSTMPWTSGWVLFAIALAYTSSPKTLSTAPKKPLRIKKTKKSTHYRSLR